MFWHLFCNKDIMLFQEGGCSVPVAVNTEIQDDKVVYCVKIWTLFNKF